MNPAALDRWSEDHREEMVRLLEAFVRIESPSDHPECNARLIEAIATASEQAGFSTRRLGNSGGADHLILSWESGQDVAAGRTLLLAHCDTVWPIGTLDRLGFRRSGGRIAGPGVLDMKASLVIGIYALRAMRELGLVPATAVDLLITTDEEIGSHDGRTKVEACGQRASRVLVLEPALAGGALKTARKGVGEFHISAHGRAAHSGVEPEKGRNAILEIAHQVLSLNDLGDSTRGTSLNVGTIRGGTKSNVVPALCEVAVDVRAWTQAEATRVETALRGLTPTIPDVTLRVSGGWNRPPMERTLGSRALFLDLQRAARELGLELSEGRTGGGSDGNFTSALGIPTVDGLGALGDGAHADHEYIEERSMPDRTTLLAWLLHRR